MHLVKAWKSSQNLTKLHLNLNSIKPQKRKSPVTIVKGSKLPWIYSKGNAITHKKFDNIFTHVEMIISHWFLFWLIIDIIFFYMLLIICHINKYQIFYISKLFLSQMQNIINFKYEYETKSNKFSPYPNSNYTEKPF